MPQGVLPEGVTREVILPESEAPYNKPENTFVKKFKQSTGRFFEFSNKLLNRQNLASPVSEFLANNRPGRLPVGRGRFRPGGKISVYLIQEPESYTSLLVLDSGSESQAVRLSSLLTPG